MNQIKNKKNVLMCSCIKPSKDGGVPNVEYYTIKGLRELDYTVTEYFPYFKGKFITDLKESFSKKLHFNGIIHCHTNMCWNNKKAIRTFHGCSALGEEIANKEKENVLKKGFGGKIYLLINKLMEQQSAKNNYCITVSQYVADALEKYYNTPKEKIKVVHNGVNSDFFKPSKQKRETFRKSLGIKDKFVVTWTGHFEFNKGINYLCNIINQLEPQKNIVFLVRSSVKKSNIPEKFKKSLSKKNVIYLEHGLNMDEFYNAGDLHLLTSTYEPFCLTILEAMCCEKTVIATNQGGHTEAITKNNGFLFNYYETDKISEKILTLSKNKKLLKKMGKNGRKRILSNFTYKHMTNKTIQAYNYFCGDNN